MLTALLSVASTVLMFTLVLLVGWWCWYQWTYRRILRAAAKIPCALPYTLPVLGNALFVLFGMVDVTRKTIEALDEARSKGWNTGVIWVGPFPLVIVADKEGIQKVLNSSNTAEKSAEYALVEFVTGQGLITALWKTWRVTRRFISPLFHSSNLEQLMVPVFNRNSKELVSNLSEQIDQGPVDVFPYTMDMSLKSVCHLIFGPDNNFEVKSNEFQCCKYAVERVADITLKRILRFWLQIDSVFKYLYNKQINKIYNGLNIFMEIPLQLLAVCGKQYRKVIVCFINMSISQYTIILHAKALKKAKIQLAEQIIDCDKDEADKFNGEFSEPINLIDVYGVLQRKHPDFSNQDLRNEIATLLVTGTDTVGLFSASFLLAVAYHREIQDKLYDEILSVVGKERDITMQDLQRMLYLDQVYNETLRFFLIVPFIGRKTTHDITLGESFIPAGFTILISLASLSRNPETFPNPLRFDPDNFCSSNEKAKEKNAFLPFSGGPRNCIGKPYAEILGKIQVVNVLRNFELSTNMDIYNLKQKMQITLKSSQGYNVFLKKRI